MLFIVPVTLYIHHSDIWLSIEIRLYCDCSSSDSRPGGSDLNHVKTKCSTWGFALPAGQNDPDVSAVSTQFKGKTSLQQHD